MFICVLTHPTCLRNSEPALLSQQAQSFKIFVHIGVAYSAPYISQEGGSTEVPLLEKRYVIGCNATQGYDFPVDNAVRSSLLQTAGCECSLVSCLEMLLNIGLRKT